MAKNLNREHSSMLKDSHGASTYSPLTWRLQRAKPSRRRIEFWTGFLFLWLASLNKVRHIVSVTFIGIMLLPFCQSLLERMIILEWIAAPDWLKTWTLINIQVKLLRDRCAKDEMVLHWGMLLSEKNEWGADPTTCTCFNFFSCSSARSFETWLGPRQDFVSPLSCCFVALGCGSTLSSVLLAFSKGWQTHPARY